MKTRIISALLILAIIIPFVVMGGTWYYLTVLTLSLLSLKEYMSAKEHNKKTPLFIKTISYVSLITLLLSIYINDFRLYIDTKVVVGIFILLLTPALLYHNKNKYNIEDACYLLGGILLIGVSMMMLIVLRNKSVYMLIYVLLIAIFTDTYAYFTGVLIGKHPLLKTISPKKSLEGTIGGTIFGVGISSAFYITVINNQIPLVHIVGISLFLSILGQFGDLIFSSIKRYYKIKDFSNLIPGHGGVLDRLDSIILIALGMMLFINIL